MTADLQTWERGLWAALFLAEGVLLVFLGKLARDALALVRGYRMSEVLTTRDNPAAAVDQCGFLGGLVLGLLGSLVVGAKTPLGQASDLALGGLVAIGVMLLADWVVDLAVFRKMDDHHEIIEQRNLALAIGRAGAALGTGFVLRGAMGHPETPLVHALGWVGVGLAAMVLLSLLYQRITPYDDLAEIAGNNVAAALPLAGMLIAVGITVEAAVYGEPGRAWLLDLGAVGIYLVASAVLIWVLRLLTDRFLLPGARLGEEIQRDRNTGAGLIEGTSFVLGALLVAFFLG